MKKKDKTSDFYYYFRQALEGSDDMSGKRRSEAARAARRHWMEIQHPLNGLGLLEDAIVQIAGLKQNQDISLDKKAVVVFCADNGVTREGVTQTDSSVTGIVAGNIAEGKTSVCRMAAVSGIDVIPVNIGMKDFTGVKGVLDRRIANGTKDIRYGPAMTGDEAFKAISTGIDLAGCLAGQGYQLLGCGEMGIGNTTTASACASVLLGLDPASVTGKGAGLSDQGLKHKIGVIREALRNNQLDPLCKESVRCEANVRKQGTGSGPEESTDCFFSETAPETIEIFRRVGGFDLLGMCGLYLGGLIFRIPILIDGFASSVAALAAARICPDCRDAMLASHLSSEPAGRLVLKTLGKEPLICAKLHLGEGTGAVLAMPMLDMALAVYRDSCTFAEGGVEAYRPL